MTPLGFGDSVLRLREGCSLLPPQPQAAETVVAELLPQFFIPTVTGRAASFYLLFYLLKWNLTMVALNVFDPQFSSLVARSLTCGHKSWPIIQLYCTQAFRPGTWHGVRVAIKWLRNTSWKNKWKPSQLDNVLSCNSSAQKLIMRKRLVYLTRGEAINKWWDIHQWNIYKSSFKVLLRIL